ncbi:MAG TPA: hypothetical protein VEK79_10365 [Thermoanaerobaculia bacterium]|nr:hypothetical protein [Thermoanaerobaculia bacterium]
MNPLGNPFNIHGPVLYMAWPMIATIYGFGRADLLASFALFHDDPARINTIEERFASVTQALI